MSAPSNRGLPPAIILAAVGALIGAGALLLPWYSLDVEAFKTALSRIFAQPGMTELLGGMDPSAIFDAIPASETDKIMKEAQGELVGYKVFAPLSVVLHVLGAAGVGAVVLKVLNGTASIGSQRGELVGGAAILALRPIIGIVNSPTAQGSKELNLGADVLLPATGLYLALFGAVLVLLSAVWAHLDSRGAEDLSLATDPYSPAPGGGAVMPSGMGPAGHAPAAAFAPTGAYVPGGPPMAAQAHAPAQAAYPPQPQQVAAYPPQAQQHPGAYPPQSQQHPGAYPPQAPGPPAYPAPPQPPQGGRGSVPPPGMG